MCAVGDGLVTTHDPEAVDTLSWIQDWYASQCDGDWEHGYGIRVETLDNPGWSVKINLTDTDLQDEPFESVKIERSKNDWVHCRAEEGFWKGWGGPNNLEEVLISFRQWVETVNSA